MSTSGIGSSGIANLLQTLTNEGVPSLSSPKIAAALQTAPANDIVSLTEAASQLQGIGQLFASSSTNSSSTASDPGSLLSSVLSSLEKSATSQSQTQSLSPSTALATQLSNLQTLELQSLFGTSSYANQPSGSLINLVA